MSWLTLSLLSYFLLAAVAIIDKFLLTGQKIKPKVYAFYVGLLGALTVVLIPFGFTVPGWIDLSLAFVSGIIWIFALISLYESFNKFEVSRIVPAIGGMLPIFTLALTYLFAWRGQNELGEFGYLKIISFILLVLGSILISLEKGKGLFKKSLIFAALTAFLFALSFSTIKIVYMNVNFISGFVWTRIAGLGVVFFLLFTKDVKQELIKNKKRKMEKSLFQRPKTAVLFLFNQIMGSGAVILQNIAISLVPAIYLAFINALDGTRYVFLLILTMIISWKFPKILSERISGSIFVQKAFAIVLIIGGLIIFSLS